MEEATLRATALQMAVSHINTRNESAKTSYFNADHVLDVAEKFLTFIKGE